jgi:RNA 2',3'-cyclic 3'-phosphodiesterase
MRLFVALEIPAEVRETLRERIAHLRTICSSAKWLRVGAIHLTLKFVGHVEADRLAPISEALASIRLSSSIDVQFRGMGFFPNEKRPRVLWVGVKAPANLAGLAAEMDRRLVPLGIPSEARPFSPHLTLARFDPDRGKLAGGLAEIVREAKLAEGEAFGSLRATEFHLFESKTKTSGAEYTRIATFAFAQR